MDNALQQINDRDQQIAHLRAGVIKLTKSILKDLQTPQALRDFQCFTGDPVKLHGFIDSIDNLMPTLERAQGTPVFDIWMHAIHSKISNEADAASELNGTEPIWDDIKNHSFQ